MKKTILIIASIFTCSTLFAQEGKPCLLIGIYNSSKNGHCTDRAIVHENVKDYAEMLQKKAEFIESHKTQMPLTRFIKANETVIVYEYDKEMIGQKCSSKIIGVINGKTIEDCNKQLASRIANNPKDYSTQPKIIYTWEGRGATSKKTITEDFGGVEATFHLVNKPEGGSFIVAKFTNKTKTSVAALQVKTPDGTVHSEKLQPGNTLTKKYDAPNLDIEVGYSKHETVPENKDIIQQVKEKVRRTVTNQNGEIKVFDPSGSPGVRG